MSRNLSSVILIAAMLMGGWMVHYVNQPYVSPYESSLRDETEKQREYNRERAAEDKYAVETIIREMNYQRSK